MFTLCGSFYLYMCEVGARALVKKPCNPGHTTSVPQVQIEVVYEKGWLAVGQDSVRHS